MKRMEKKSVVKSTASKVNDTVTKINKKGTRMYDKITPKYEVTWYIKWTSTVFLLLAAMSANIFQIPEAAHIVLTLAGILGWFTVGMLWNDRALIVLTTAVGVMLVLHNVT